MVENGKDSGFYFFLFLFNNLEGGLSTLGDAEIYHKSSKPYLKQREYG